jgi:serine/threonine protein phosphatase 1
MIGDTPPRPSVTIDRFTPPLPGTRARSTGGRVVYAIGDVHGCYRLLKGLLGAIVADIAARPDGAPPIILLCGDYVDRGPDSASVLSALVWLARHSTVEMLFLKGNHEAMLLDFLRRPERNADWLRDDGRETLRSYGIDPPAGDEPSDQECVDLRDRLADTMPASHIDFLRDLPVRHLLGDYAFVHAGLRPGRPIDRQTEEDCLWIREDFLATEHRFERIVVHGHTWSSSRPHVGAHRIGLDTGAYATGVLTAVRLDGTAIDCIQACEGDTTMHKAGRTTALHGAGNR